MEKAKKAMEKAPENIEIEDEDLPVREENAIFTYADADYDDDETPMNQYKLPQDLENEVEQMEERARKDEAIRKRSREEGGDAVQYFSSSEDEDVNENDDENEDKEEVAPECTKTEVIEITEPSKSVKSKKKGGKRRSKVWEYFTLAVVDGKTKAICKFCEEDLAAHSKINGTSSLWNHVRKCLLNPAVMKNQAQLNSNLQQMVPLPNFKFYSSLPWRMLEGP